MNKLIRQFSKTGFEFEFYTELNNNDLKNKLESLLNKKIILSEKYHSDVSVNEKIFKLEPDFSTGIHGKELVTGPMNYKEAQEVLEKVLNFIRRYGESDNKTAIHLNLSYEKNLIESLKHSFNDIKFILEYDEDLIYEIFPNRKNNVYAKSIKSFKPANSNYIISSNNFNKNTIIHPTSKYYGVNFEKLKSDYLEFRYLGGEFYEYKIDDIKEIWNYSLDAIYNCSETKLNETQDIHFKQIKEFYDSYHQLKKDVSDLASFKRAFPDIKLTIDMNTNEKVINNKLYFLSNKLTELLYTNKLEKGKINFDSEKGRFQLKNFEIANCDFKNIDLISCKVINSMIQNESEIHNCNLTNCYIEESKSYKVNFNKSKLKNVFVDKKCDLNECYLHGTMSFFGGNMRNKSIFREGYMLNSARVDEKTCQVIEYKKLK